MTCPDDFGWFKSSFQVNNSLLFKAWGQDSNYSVYIVKKTAEIKTFSHPLIYLE